MVGRSPFNRGARTTTVPVVMIPVRFHLLSDTANPVVFDPTAPNRVWATDVTYVWTEEGWLYLAVILDLFARRVVGWAASATNDDPLAIPPSQK